jgi:hypothetical protein
MQNTSILARKSRHMDWIIREEIQLHPYMNRENGFSLSRSWKPLISTLSPRSWCTLPFILPLLVVLVRTFLDSCPSEACSKNQPLLRAC